MNGLDEMYVMVCLDVISIVRSRDLWVGREKNYWVSSIRFSLVFQYHQTLNVSSRNKFKV